LPQDGLSRSLRMDPSPPTVPRSASPIRRITGEHLSSPLGSHSVCYRPRRPRRQSSLTTARHHFTPTAGDPICASRSSDLVGVAQPPNRAAGRTVSTAVVREARWTLGGEPKPVATAGQTPGKTELTFSSISPAVTRAMVRAPPAASSTRVGGAAQVTRRPPTKEATRSRDCSKPRRPLATGAKHPPMEAADAGCRPNASMHFQKPRLRSNRPVAGLGVAFTQKGKRGNNGESAN
jgi:hypothetical protein